MRARGFRPRWSGASLTSVRLCLVCRYPTYSRDWLPKGRVSTDQKQDPGQYTEHGQANADTAHADTPTRPGGCSCGRTEPWRARWRVRRRGVWARPRATPSPIERLGPAVGRAPDTRPVPPCQRLGSHSELTLTPALCAASLVWLRRHRQAPPRPSPPRRVVAIGHPAHQGVVTAYPRRGFLRVADTPARRHAQEA